MTSPETLELEAVDAALAGREVAPEHAELAELALLLRDDRPEPSETWATRMDRRVETRFPARPRRRPRLRIGTWWKPVAVVASLLLPVVLAAALTSGRSGDDSSDGGGGGGMAGAAQETAPNAGADDSAGAGIPPEVRSTGNPRSDAHDRRSVQRSATLTLAAPRREIDGVAGRIADVTADVGGFVAASSITSSDGGDLDLRVPANRLDTAIQRISKLARVRGLSRQSLDITGQVVSARDRLREARAERESLLRQLANAVTVNETESIRARLRIVSREIASAHASLRRVRNRANFADVHVTLVRSRADGAEGAWTPGDAFHDALRVLEVAAGVAVIAAAVALPLAIAWLLGWLARRGVTRRRRERALDMA